MATILKNLSEVIGEIPSGLNKKIVIIVSEWNDNITFKLRDGAVEGLLENHVREDDIKIHYVPGCFELPLAAQSLIETYSPDAVICLGCVIKGDTPHFDYVCSGTTDGILQVNLQTKTPVIFGVLTTNNLEQAVDRAGGKYGNKGVEAALSALKMIQYKRK